MSFSDQRCTNFNVIQSISTSIQKNHLHNKTVRERHFVYSVRSNENLLLQCSSCLNLHHYGNWSICTTVVLFITNHSDNGYSITGNTDSYTFV